MSQLPQGWETVYFKDAIEIIRGVTFSKQDRRETSAEGYIPCLRTSNIQETIEVDDLAYIPVQLVKQKDRFIRPDDIIISMSNSRELVGKVAKADASLNGFTYGAFLSVLRSSKFNPDFLYYLLRSPRVQHEMRLTAGQTVNIANLSISGMSKIQLPLPPIAEQRRIVARLDSLLAQSKAARAELNKALALAKRQRQAVLAKAFSGELTQDWREKRAVFNDHELKPLFKLCTSITDGDHQAPPKVTEGIPFITISAINDGKLQLSKATRFVPQTYIDSLKASRKPSYGDILFSVTGSIAIPALVDTDNMFTFQRHIAILKPDYAVINNYYLRYMLEAPQFTKEAINIATGTAQLTIPLSGLKALEIPLPSLEEQKEIVKRIEAALSQIETMENEAKKALALAERLEQATLAKAFQGQL